MAPQGAAWHHGMAILYQFGASGSLALHLISKFCILQVPDIFTLNFVPWGNAKIDSSGEFQCQHGEMECVMNTVEACALNYYSNM